MSRRTRSPRRPQAPAVDSHGRIHVNDLPRLEQPLQLTCRACRTVGWYRVGVVTIDPVTLESEDDPSCAVGFTGYFRCQACDEGGPWELSAAATRLIGAMLLAYANDEEDVPLLVARVATFDETPMRYCTDAEAHVKRLIEKQPERVFLWVRLGNLYRSGDVPDLAKEAFRRALELDPTDIEAHAMLGQILMDADRPLDAVPHFHAILKNAPQVRSVDRSLRRLLVRGSIERLLEAHAQARGQFDLFPTTSPEDLKRGHHGEPVIIVAREFDLGTDEGLEELCDVFLQERSSRFDLLKGRANRARRRLPQTAAGKLRHDGASVPRNAACPCGSGRKYKKCCGASSFAGAGGPPSTPGLSP